MHGRQPITCFVEAPIEGSTAPGLLVEADAQYQGLRVAEKMLLSLGPEQKARLKKALEHRRSGEPETHIAQQSERWPVSERILAAIKQTGGS